VALDDTSWVDVTRGWLSDADELFDALLTGVAWQTSQLFRYDHWVEERRLGAAWRPGTPLPHPALADAHLERGNVYFSESNFDAAVTDYQAALSAHPDYALVR